VPGIQGFPGCSTGTIAPTSKRVRSRTVEDALRSVGPMFAGLEQPDPGLTSNGNIDSHSWAPPSVSVPLMSRPISLRAADATALLCAHVYTDITCLVGRWRSDEMLRYLHVQAEPIMRGFSAAHMLHHGSFVLLPNNDVPCF
jgi:hypothetical protein